MLEKIFGRKLEERLKALIEKIRPEIKQKGKDYYNFDKLIEKIYSKKDEIRQIEKELNASKNYSKFGALHKIYLYGVKYYGNGKNIDEKEKKEKVDHIRKIINELGKRNGDF